jgi:hypothetical protein
MCWINRLDRQLSQRSGRPFKQAGLGYIIRHDTDLRKHGDYDLLAD